MRRGYSFVSREELAHIPKIIKSLGHHLMSDHQIREDFSDIESGLHSDGTIFEKQPHQFCYNTLPDPTTCFFLSAEHRQFLQSPVQ